MYIYRGEICNMHIKNIEITENCVGVITETVSLKNDSIFYHNFLGKLVNLEYQTVLASFDEAEGYLRTCFANKSNIRSCLYACYGEMYPEEITRKQFKQLKKQFRNNR